MRTDVAVLSKECKNAKRTAVEKSSNLCSVELWSTKKNLTEQDNKTSHKKNTNKYEFNKSKTKKLRIKHDIKTYKITPCREWHHCNKHTTDIIHNLNPAATRWLKAAEVNDNGAVTEPCNPYQTHKQEDTHTHTHTQLSYQAHAH